MIGLMGSLRVSCASAFFPATARMCTGQRNHFGFFRPLKCRNMRSTRSSSTTSSESGGEPVSLYRSEGLFCVDKPLEWTSSNVVSYIRNMLMREARERGADPVKPTSRKNKSRILKVGHGGTLDPLATGVLVVGVGKGTKELQRYEHPLCFQIV